MNPDYVDKALRDYYPTSTQITMACNKEISRGFVQRGLGTSAFDDALDRHRAEGKGHKWPPTMRDLVAYLPVTKATASATRDTDKRCVLWPEHLRNSPRWEAAAIYWAQAEFVMFYELLLDDPGITQEERVGAQRDLERAIVAEEQREKRRATRGPTPFFSQALNNLCAGVARKEAG